MRLVHEMSEFYINQMTNIVVLLKLVIAYPSLTNSTLSLTDVRRKRRLKIYTNKVLRTTSTYNWPNVSNEVEPKITVGN